MMLLASRYLNVLYKEALEEVVNLVAIPLKMKGPNEEETNSPGKQYAKASSSFTSSSNLLTRIPLPLLVIKEELKVLNDKFPE